MHNNIMQDYDNNARYDNISTYDVNAGYDNKII